MYKFEWTQEIIDGQLVDVGTSQNCKLVGHFTDDRKTLFEGVMTHTNRPIKYSGSFTKDVNWVPHGYCKKFRILKEPCETLLCSGEISMMTEWLTYEGMWLLGHKGTSFFPSPDAIYTDGKKYIYRNVGGIMKQFRINGNRLHCRKYGIHMTECNTIPYCKIYTTNECIYDLEKEIARGECANRPISYDDAVKIVKNIMEQMAIKIRKLPCEKCLQKYNADYVCPVAATTDEMLEELECMEMTLAYPVCCKSCVAKPCNLDE